MKGVNCMLVAAGWLITAHGSIAGGSNADAHALFEQGLAEYEIGHYAQAIRDFKRAADEGDARSTEILALMYRFGERYYGNQVHADSVEAARWVNFAVDRRLVAITAAAAAGH